MKKKTRSGLLAVLLAAAIGICGCGTGSPEEVGNIGQGEGTEAAAASSAASAEEATQAAEAAGTLVSVSGITITPDDNASAKDTMIIAMPSDPGTVDMHYSTAYDYVQPFIISKLLTQQFAQDGSVQAVTSEESLAESYEYDEDYMGVTFILKEGVTFTNGNTLTASDVVFSIRLCSDQSYYSMIDFDNLDAVDDRTVYMPLIKADANALYNVGVMLPIYDEQYYNELNNEAEFFSTSAIGSGPYKITEWVSGDHLTLEANENYYAGAPKIKNLILRFITDASVAFMEMQSGGVDVVTAPNWTDIEEVLNSNISGITCWEESSVYTLQLGMNCGGVLSDLKLRQAVASAIDKASLVAGSFEGSGVDTYCLVSNSLPGTIDYSDKWPYTYDPEKAKALLAEAGYEAGEVELTCIVGAGGGPRTAAAEMMVGYLDAVGIKMTIREVDIATYASMITDSPDEWDLWLRNFGSGLGNAPSAHDYFAQNVKVNCFIDEQDTSAKMLDLANEMGSTMEEGARNEIYAQLQDYYLNECLYTYPLLQAQTYTLVNSDLVNFSKCGQISWNIKDAYFK